jgi:hypothetical protein
MLAEKSVLLPQKHNNPAQTRHQQSFCWFTGGYWKQENVCTLLQKDM